MENKKKEYCIKDRNGITIGWFTYSYERDFALRRFQPTGVPTEEIKQ